MDLYILLKNELIDTATNSVLFTDVVAVFNSKDLLDKALNECQDTDSIFYEVKVMPMNILIDTETTDDILSEMVNDGSLEVFVDENGNFHFEKKNED
jgi:hypothetical protein